MPAGILAEILKPLFEVLIGKLWEVFFGPEKVQPESKPVLEKLDALSSDAINDSLVDRFSLLVRAK
jgi:hypothetical protein